MHRLIHLVVFTAALAPLTGVACGGVTDGEEREDVGKSGVGEQRSALGPANSCFSYCGTNAPSGCWCDSACTGLGDCCSDYTPQCVSGGSCANNCTSGNASGGGCYCDEFCTGFGDCCSDYAAVCPSCGVGTRTWRLPAVTLAPRTPLLGIGLETKPIVGAAGNGDAIAVYNYNFHAPTGSLVRNVRTRRFTAGAWAPEVNLGSDVSTAPWVEVGTNGRAFTSFGAQEWLFRPATGWSDAGLGFNPVAAAVDGTGNTMLLYQTGAALDARRLTSGGALEASRRMSDNATMWDIASNKLSDFAAVYNIGANLVYGRYSVGVGWTGTGFATGTSPRVGIASDRSVIVAWIDGNSIKAKRFTDAIGGTVTVSTHAEAVYDLKLAVSANGRAMVTWKRNFPGGFDRELWASSFYAPTGWSAASLVTAVKHSPESPPGRPGIHDVGIDDCGAGHLVYEEHPYSAFARRFTPGLGWTGGATLIGSTALRAPRMATAPNGMTTVVWDGELGDVLAARFE